MDVLLSGWDSWAGIIVTMSSKAYATNLLDSQCRYGDFF
jgi:hypothetical protein